MTVLTQEERELIRASVARMRASVMAVVFGILGGFCLFAATGWLVFIGGEVVGPHLGLLGAFFPGYSVTWRGSFIGLGYGVVAGALLGYSVAALYNRLAGRRASVERVGRPKGRRSS